MNARHWAVIHIPHASVTIPADMRATLTLTDAELENELLLMTDRYTDELFEVDTPDVIRIVFPFSRLIVDPERFLDDDDEPMAAVGMGAVYMRTSGGNCLRDEDFPDRQKLIDRFYVPHHTRLTETVEAALAAWGRCLLLDCHSFSSIPLPHELDQQLERPDICIGTDDYHTSPWLLDLAMSTVESQGLSVEVNRPFSGTLIPLPFFRKDKRVAGLMIEVNRKLYMHGMTGRKLENFDDIRRKIAAILERLIRAITPSS
jgi:N-formylglutamate amidohydrolase